MASSRRTKYRSNGHCIADCIGGLVRITRRTCASLSRIAGRNRTWLNELWSCIACDAALSTADGLRLANATTNGTSMVTTSRLCLAAYVRAANAAAYGLLITYAATYLATDATNNLDATTRLWTTLRPTLGLWPASSRLRIWLKMIRIHNENNFKMNTIYCYKF